MNQFKAMQTILPMMRADFLERVRSYSFLVMLLFSIFLTYFFLPAPDASLYANLAMAAARPVYTSAAIGSMTTLLMSEFFSLFAFYLVKGSIERDRRTGVGQVIAATPISRPVYVLGKWFSNVAVLAVMLAVIILAAGVLQLMRGEDPHIHLWALSAPFIIVLLPALILVAALAVLFESINLLRGGLGNVMYFGVFLLLLGLPIDFEGINVLYPGLYQACAAQFSGCSPVRQIDIGGALAGLPTFAYAGIHWTWKIVTRRLLFVAAGALVALLAALPFHRFDPARSEGSALSRFFQRVKQEVTGFVTAEVPSVPTRLTPLVPGEEDSQPGKPISSLSSIPKPETWKADSVPIFLRVFAAEFRLAFKGVRWWWFVGAIALVIAGVAVPMGYIVLVVLPLAWIWPLLIWSGIGAREVQHRVEQLVFCTPYPLKRQLPAAWLVGALVALGMASGVILRLALLGLWQSLPAVIACALLIPTLALSAGCWTGGGKLFQAGYLFIWYITSMNGLLYLVIMGIPAAQSIGIALAFVALAVLMAAFAVLGRMFNNLR